MILYRCLFSDLFANKGVNQRVALFAPFSVSQKFLGISVYGLLRHDVRDSILTYHSKLLV